MRKVIALDIGGTNTRLAIIDEKYHLETVDIRKTVTGSKDAFIKSVVKIIKDHIDGKQAYEAIGIGVPGRVSPDGYIAALPNVGIEDIDLAHILEDQFHLPVFIRNDAEVAALAEANVGPFHELKKLYFVTISTGIGGALTLDGRIHPSFSEPGHVLVKHNGELVELEHLASGTGIVRLCADHAVFVDSAKDFLEGKAAGDADMLEPYEHWIELLSFFFNSVQKTFMPDAFVLTGGVMKSKEVFLEDLRKACPDCRIEECGCGQYAGLMGAAAMAWTSL